jgi:5-methylcytosine-specific restriction endonuclease McrA
LNNFKKINKMKRLCFECVVLGYAEAHHVVPRSLSGKKTVYLCHKCHSLAHGNEKIRRSDHSPLIKEALKKRKDMGIKLGRPTESTENMDNLIIVRMTADEKKHLFDSAKESGVSASKFIRMALSEMLKA